MNDATQIPNLTITDVPIYPEIPTYGAQLGALHIWEGDGWKQESMSWKTGAYIASNLSGPGSEVTVSGSNAQKFLSRLSINNVYSWPIGKSKHLVMPDAQGYIASHALVVRDSEDSFRQFAPGFPWVPYMASTLGIDVEIGFRAIFLYQIAGPASLQILERVIGKPLREVRFLDIAKIRIPGIETEVEIELSRIGMSGTLAYELRGPFDIGPAVYDAVYQAGRDFGIKRLGWRTYVVNHTEGGFPQQGCTFLPSIFADQAFLAHSGFFPLVELSEVLPCSGSIDPTNLQARLRTPQEVNWGWMAKFDHDFIGREAVEAEAANPRRKTVTLRWNKEDVIDVFASQFELGEEFKNFEFPTTPQSPAGGHADLVSKGDNQVGVSSVAVYSYYYRQMISHCAIDVDQAELGNEVIVHWGDYGARIKPIRATVDRFPYLDLPTNKDHDLDAIPSGVGVRSG